MLHYPLGPLTCEPAQSQDYQTVMFTDICVHRSPRKLEANTAKYARDVDGVTLWAFFPWPQYNNGNVFMRNITSDFS